MNPAIFDLNGYPDEKLFDVISEGATEIMNNAVELDKAAGRLHGAGEQRASDILRGLAEEEAAKVLILLDVVRCPTDSGFGRRTLGYFLDHLAKRVYALTSSFPNVLTFAEVCELARFECRPFFLDGPNGVDWIFSNTIKSHREGSMYVDYVRDITGDDANCFWNSPVDMEDGDWPYESSDAVNLGQALVDVGVTTRQGLALVAELWRGFHIDEATDRADLRYLIAQTLERLCDEGCEPHDGRSPNLVLTSWSFPLWPLDIAALRKEGESVTELRQHRQCAIEHIEETQAKREPRPAIVRDKVEHLSKLYASWQREVDTIYAANSEGSRLRTFSSDKAIGLFRLPSYVRLKKTFSDLEESERMSLLALAWFTRDTVADWSRTFEYARERVSDLDDTYQIGLGAWWLAGFRRWEEAPRPFQAGTWYQPWTNR